jgi:uncharacterized membrane protein AbrB (regulator of aidB expression)
MFTVVLVTIMYLVSAIYMGWLLSTEDDDDEG